MKYQTAEAMFEIDSKGRILFWNRAAQNILGFRPEEVVGQSCWKVISGKDLVGNPFCFDDCAVLTMARRNQVIQSYDTEAVTKSGKKIWINISIISILNPEKKEPAIVHLFRPLCHPPIRKVTLPQTRAEHSAGPALTPRETEILSLMAEGLVAKEIAARLKLSNETVRKHIGKILKKFKVHTKLEAVVSAIKQRLLPSSN